MVVICKLTIDTTDSIAGIRFSVSLNSPSFSLTDSLPLVLQEGRHYVGQVASFGERLLVAKIIAKMYNYLKTSESQTDVYHVIIKVIYFFNLTTH